MKKGYIIYIVLSMISLACAIAAIILHKRDTAVFGILTTAALVWGAVVFYSDIL
jgi:hypothetical protein